MMAEPAELPTPASFETLVAWRRDVRRFRDQPVAPELLDHLLNVAHLAPSVGNSQPWRVVQVRSAARRAAVKANFQAANIAASARYGDERRARYLDLKLAGFDQAPVHLCVFCEGDPVDGHGLGRQTQPEALAHSCAGMITVLWLAARTHGVGLGWVSILEPHILSSLLDVPDGWTFIGYLLLGYPEEEHLDPELVRHGWQARGTMGERTIVR